MITILGCTLLELSLFDLCSTLSLTLTCASILDKCAFGEQILRGKEALRRHIAPQKLDLFVDVGIISHDGVQPLIHHQMRGPELVMDVRVGTLQLVQS